MSNLSRRVEWIRQQVRLGFGLEEVDTKLQTFFNDENNVRKIDDFLTNIHTAPPRLFVFFQSRTATRDPELFIETSTYPAICLDPL